MSTKCRYCGSTNYSSGCIHSPTRKHEHSDDEKHCEWCGVSISVEIRENCPWPGWLVKMTVGGVKCMRYIDTGAAYSYVHNLSTDFPSAGIADECSFDGRPWTAPMHRVPCEFAGHPFEIFCGDARDSKANPNGCAVPLKGVIGYDFCNNFTIVIDRIGGQMGVVKKETF